MRLFEFTNPSQYLLPETDAADLSNNMKKADAADPVHRLSKKTDGKKPTDTR
jgi:hypothetical protein